LLHNPPAPAVLKYLTVAATLSVVIRGFTRQADADGAKFSLLRRDNQKKILDSTSPRAKKTSALEPLAWSVAIDEETLEQTLEETEMQCEMYVSVTAGGKTWSPPGQQYVLYRNKIVIVAKDGENANLAGAHCTCTIRSPEDYRPPSVAVPDGAGSGEAVSYVTAPDPVPRTVVTGEDGTVELPLDAPGELDLVWSYPYYPKDQAAWLAQKGKKREAVLLERERKARFLWPEAGEDEARRHYVNLLPRAGAHRGRRLRIVVGIDGGRAGDRIYLGAELQARDSKDLDGKPLECDFGGALEVGKPKKTLTLTLDADGGTKALELDFKGWGGITAKLAVSTVEGSTDESLEVTSWRKVEVQPYLPAPGFFADDAFPETLRQKAVAAFEEVFIELEFLEPQSLTEAFSGVECPGSFEIVKISGERARNLDLDPGSRQGDAALVWFKMGDDTYATPAHWVKHRPGASANAARYAGVYASTPQTRLHVIFGHLCYAPKSALASLTLTADKLVSEPQSTKTVLRTDNIDANESLVLPWDSRNTSYWQVEGEETRGEITPEFVEIDRDKAKTGVYEYKVKLPEGAVNDPAGLARAGKRVSVHVRLRGYEYGVGGQGLFPVLYVGMPPGDEAASRGAYTLIHEIAHALGFAPPKGECYYRLNGAHCAYGLKSDAESYVRENSGTVGATLHATITQGVPGTNVPLQLVSAGKFGKCVMFGHTHRQKTTESHFAAALKFCEHCAPLMRVTPIGSRIGGDA
jgi:hypothetical protein